MSETPQNRELPQETEAQQLEINTSSIEKYESALQLAFYEGQISWQMNVLFVGLNIGIGTMLQDHLANLTLIKPLTFWLSIAGFIINIFWLGTFFRNNKYYRFRMAQARNAEPEMFSLVNNRGYKFSKGKKIEIGAAFGDEDSSHKLNWFEQICSNKNAIIVSIFCFLIAYAFLITVYITHLP